MDHPHAQLDPLSGSSELLSATNTRATDLMLGFRERATTTNRRHRKWAIVVPAAHSDRECVYRPVAPHADT